MNNSLVEKIDEAKELLGDRIKDIISIELDLKDFDGKKSFSPFRDEDNKSFIWNQKELYFKDFGNGRVVGIIDALMISNNCSYYDAVKKLFDLVNFKYNDDEFESLTGVNIKNIVKAKDEPYNDRKIVEEYALKRGISKETLDFCNIKQSQNGEVAFQFYNENNELISTKYRVSRPADNKAENKWIWQNNITVHSLLYGVNKINFEKPLLIVEGLFDRCAIVEAGYPNVVSIPGGANDYKWIDYNYDFLDKFQEIIIWFDDDNPGKEGAKTCANRLGEYRVRTVTPTDDIKESIAEYYKKYNKDIDKVDANNVLVICGKDAVLRLISGAKIADNPQVKHLMDYDEIQLQDIPRISTGMSAMDKNFYGSFENSLTIVTGTAGSGKSSFLNTMFIAAPLEAGEKVFIYSGEIPNGMLLGNIIKPLASCRHIRVFKNQGQPDGYNVTKKAASVIKEYYRDYVFNYDDTNTFDTNSKSIINSMTYSYKRYGVKNFIVDSLLTVDCSCEIGDDKYEKQKNFVLNLKSFTNKYPVRVALVAHSRKLPVGSKDISMDDIAGSSDIIKAANRAYTIKRLDGDNEGYNLSVTCIKDRESGAINRTIKMKYDRRSYRIYSTDQELDKAYKWEYERNINYTEEEKKHLSCNIKYEDEYNDILGEVR